MMYPWTRLFGTSLFALRFPSVLFGIGSILLLALLGARLHGPRVGLLAAALMAFNGMQIFWSQMARMYAMICCLALLTTLHFSPERQTGVSEIDIPSAAKLCCFSDRS